MTFAFNRTSEIADYERDTRDGAEKAPLVREPEDVVMEEDTLPEAGAEFARISGQSGVAVLIEKKAHRLTVMRDGVKLKEYGIAVGKNGGDKKRVGDMRTPEGVFPVQRIENASKWTHDFRDGKGAIKNAYGPLFIRLDTDPWKGIGIHGTHDPASIGTDVTEGCVRLNNGDLLEFRGLIAVGTKVLISP
ncbi:MAG: L,D-transpeptidase [Synergistaceae bacterium]|nr:L,D-transpeptidase [Synergistaceae bacterium]